MAQPQYKLARFAKYGPPPLTQEQKLKKEKGFVLDAVAVSTLSDDSGRANPKMATAIPPYNAQKNRHSKGYFEKPVVRKLLKKTDQECPGDSIAGKQMDKFYDKGMMGDYIKRRNSAGAGHSTSQVGGHGLFMENILPLNGFNGCFGFRRNTPSLRNHPSVFIGKILALAMYVQRHIYRPLGSLSPVPEALGDQSAHMARVAIIGAGIGGLTLAKTLLEGGKTEVTIYEAWDHWKARGGALGLAAGKRILEHFGLSEELAEVSNSSEGYTWQFHAKGSKLSFVNVPGCIAMRTDLQRVLVDSMPPDVVKLDHKLVDIVEGDHEVLLTFENGVTASADLVVASDGIHSFVRQKIFGEDVPHFTGFRVLYSVSSTPYRPDPSISKTHWLEAEGAGYAILEMTAGRGSTRHDLCVLILRSEEAITDRWDSTMVKERFEQVAQCLDLPVLQAAVRHAELCFDWGVYESPPRKSWISPRQRIVLLGDAAHATAPFLAQGANMAMHDAYCLGQILLKEEISLSKGLQLYEASRKIYCEGVVAKSSRMGEMHTATGLRAAFRNYFLSACVLRNMSTLFRTDPTKHMPWEKHESLLQRLGRSVSSICSEKPWVHW